MSELRKVFICKSCEHAYEAHVTRCDCMEYGQKQEFERAYIIPAELLGKILTLCTLAENGLISSAKYEAKQLREMMGEA